MLKPRKDNQSLTSNQNPKTKTNIMKITIKSTLTSLSLLLASIAFSSCADTAGSGTHNMGNPKTQTPMSNAQMPGR